jgi:uncharacterized protein YecT (DUF1311 family)
VCPTCSSLVSVSACTFRIEASVRTQFLRITALMVWLLISTCLATGQTHKQKSDPCKDTSHMTQALMNDCALKNLHEAELKLERLLKQLGIAANSPEQKAWEAYRDAQVAALYPPGDTSSYGSVYPMCLAVLKQGLTEGRIRDLKALTTSGEGDVCNGYRASGSKSN